MTIIPFETRANGKLLLTGEYFVLDGATALAIPVRYGQSLKVAPHNQANQLLWESRELDGSLWFSAVFELPFLRILNTTDQSVAEMLTLIIRDCQRQNPLFLSDNPSISVSIDCDFPRTWGLGTSSTLIATMARWAQVNPYPVLQNTLGGSGYDIACAYSESPLLYRLEAGKPVIQAVAYEPPFSENLYFVFLEQKQNSREGIRRYREKAKNNAALIAEVSGLTEQILLANTLEDFEHSLRKHEQIIGQALDIQPIKARLFADYWGEIKSLGAWGGDFILITSNKNTLETSNYFAAKGFRTFMPWNKMIRQV